MVVGDCLKAAIGILFLLVLFRQLVDPAKNERREEFRHFVNTASTADHIAYVTTAWLHPVQNQGKYCKDVIVPVCESLHTTSPLMQVRLFCDNMLEYCKRYKPDLDNIPEY